jgi:hypothetical protein
MNRLLVGLVALVALSGTAKAQHVIVINGNSVIVPMAGHFENRVPTITNRTPNRIENSPSSNGVQGDASMVSAPTPIINNRYGQLTVVGRVYGGYTNNYGVRSTSISVIGRYGVR